MGEFDTGLELPQGTLDLLILRALTLGPRHGWGITERLEQVSRHAVRVKQGSLYPALHRLERQGLVRGRWGASESNRRAKYYELTRKGRVRLREQTALWERLQQAVGHVLEEA
ncbi:MAG: PadR family transcriptional regulator [Terriglobales bacterium]